MKRADAIKAMMYCGYHSDRQTWTRLFVEHRIAFSPAQAAFTRGEQLRSGGMPCGCRDCQERTMRAAINATVISARA